MTSYRVTIPDDKGEFFLQFAELLGANVEADNTELFDEVKKMLDERLKTNESLFVPATEAIKILAEKYSIH